MIRKYALPALAILGVALAVAMVIRGNEEAPAAAPAVQPSSAPFAAYIFGPGIVEAGSENIAVGTPVSGIVSAVYVKWGDRVRADAALFKVDTRDLEAQLIPANAKVQEAEAQLPPANARIAEAQATLEKAQTRLKSGEGLLPGVSITAQDLDGRRSDVSIDTAALASAKAQAAQIEAQIASAKADVERIERQIALRTVRAPVAGRILQLTVRPGEYAQSGAIAPAPVLLGDDTTLHVRVEIDETDAWKFQPCARAEAQLRGNPQIKTPLQYVRTDPDVVPMTLLTGDATQRTDTRVLDVIYSFNPASLPVYVGQLMDVFIEAPPAGAAAPRSGAPCGGGSSGPASGEAKPPAGERRKP